MFRLKTCLRFCKRNFSTHEKTTDEKAAEIGNHAWPKAKKYAILVIPSTIFIVVSIDIINNLNHRYYLEDIFPNYVETIRKYYGFIDEDPVERARVKYVSNEEQKPVNVTVTLRDGSEFVFNQINGDQSTQSLQFTIHDKLISCGIVGYTPMQLLSRINFNDKVERDNSVTSYGELNADENNRPLGMNVNDDDGTVNNYDGALLLNSDPLYGWRNSIWSTNTNFNDSYNNSNNNNVNKHTAINTSLWSSSSSSINAENNSSAIKDNISEQHNMTDKGLQKYVSNSDNIFGLLSDTSSGENHNRIVRKNRANTKGASRSVYHDKLYAIESIHRLEAQIQDLELELRSGKREIDVIEAEINFRRNEITNIRRKYLNSFYFF